MSTSPVSLSSVLSQNQEPSPAQQTHQDFNKLSKSIQAGDLHGAQQAFSSLQQQHNAQGPDTGDGAASNTISSDFKAVGQAIQSGDVNAARTTFAKLQSDLKSTSQGTSSTPASTLSKGLKAHHHRRAHHGSSAQGSTAATDTTTTGASSSLGSTGQTVNILA